MGLRDPISSSSHLLFGLWTIYALLLLLRISSSSWERRVAVVIYGSSMALLYFASGTFHGVPFTKSENPLAFRLFQRIDQSAIFTLIAGTNTPLIVTFLRGRRRRICLQGMWGLAFAGVASLWLLPSPPHALIVLICVAMGWLGLVPMTHYYRAVGWRAMNWVWAGAILYTLGAVCELAEWPRLSNAPLTFGFHEIFHLLSAAASVAFFLFIAWHVIPYRPADEMGDDGNASGCCNDRFTAPNGPLYGAANATFRQKSLTCQ